MEIWGGFAFWQIKGGVIVIIFSPDLMTGVDEIDEQHEEMIRRINALTALRDESISDEDAEKLLSFLGEYITTHFEDEEELQLRTEYPNYEWHKEMHQWYVAEYYRMKEEYMFNGPTPEFTQLLEKSMMSWFVRHISNVDKLLGKHILDERLKEKK
jgi:hemerythrin